MEDRITPSPSTITVESSSPVTIPIANLKAGQTQKIQVDFTTSDPNDQSEGEPLIIQGSDGFSQTISNYGTQTISVPITQNGDTLSAYIQGADGDESASIVAGDRTIQVKMDLAALSAPWLSYLDDLEKSEEAFESILQYSPGFTFYPPKLGAPEITGEIAGQISEAPDGSIDGGQVSITGGVKDDITTELYYGLPAKLFGIGGSLTLGGGLSVSAMATWQDNGDVTYSGQLKGEFSLTAALNGYATFFKGTLSIKGAIEGTATVTTDGDGKAELALTGEAAAAIQYKGLTQEKYVTLLSITKPFDSIPLGETEFKVSDIANYAVQLAIGPDPLVVTSQPPAKITAGTPFGVVVTAKNADGTVNTAYNGTVTVGDDYGFSLGGTTTVQAVNGVATFTGLTLNAAHTYDDYLYFTGSGQSTVYSQGFTVAAAAATKVAASAPSGVVVNSPFDLTVNAEDQYGNVDPTYNGNVTLALSGNTGGATLGGTLTVAAVNGVANFSGLTINQKGNAYTLTASSNGLTNGTTAAFKVTDQLVVTTQPPATIAAGSPFGLVVTAEDGLGNPDPSFNGTVTIADAYGYSLGGTLTVTAVNGVATFSGLTLDAAGYSYLNIASSGLATAYSQGITVTAAAATKLVASAPSGVLVNGPFDLTVNAEDQYGNVDPTFDGNVTLALGGNTGGATLGGTLTVAAVNGVANFSGLTINQTGSGYTLFASSSGLTNGTTAAFKVTDQLVVTTQPPATIAAGSPFGLVVTAEDGLGNPDPSFNGTVTIADAYGYSLAGTLTVTAVNGVATFSGLTLVAPGYSYLNVNSSGLATVYSQGFTVAAAGATKLTVAAPNGTILTNAPFTWTVNAEDPYGNVDTTFNGNVTLSLASNPGSATLGGTLTVAAVNGVATFSGLTINEPGVGYTLQASSTGLTIGTSTAFSVLDQLVVTTPPPSSVTAGSSFGLVVKDEDGLGNVVTSFNGSATVANDYYGGTLGGTLTVTAVNGVATFSGLTLTQATSYASLSASSNGLQSASTNEFTVTGAAATKLAAAAPYGTILTNAPFTVTVNAEDHYGNVDPTFNGSVTLALSSNPGNATLGGTLTVVAVNGVATFSGLTINKPDSGYTLKASSSGLTTGTSTAFSVLDQLVVTTAPPSSVTAGSSFGLVVKDEDGLGNVVTSFNGSVTVANDYYGGTLGGTLTVTAVSGVATFSGLTLTQATTYASLSASSNGLQSATTSDFTVTAAAATKLAVALPYGNILTSASFTVTVNAEDQYGNVDPTFGGNVTLALSGNTGSATLGGTLTVAAVNGVATFSGLTINEPGVGYTLQASSTGLTKGTSTAFSVLDQLVVTTPPTSSVTAGSSFGLVVEDEDGLGNVITSFNGSVTVANPYSYYGGTLGGTLTVTAVNGVATFSGLTLTQATSYASLSASSNGLQSATTSYFTVMAAAATKLALAAPYGTILANALLTVTVNAEDPYGNVDATFNGNVTLSLASNPGSATLGGTLTVAAVNGVATFSGVTINEPGLGYTLQASSSGLTTGTSTAFSVLDQLVVTTAPPSSVTAGSSFGLVVKDEDGLGNVVTSFNGSVTVANNYYGGTLGGTLMVTAVNGVATFSGLTLTQATTYASLSASSSGLQSASTNEFTVTGAAATKLAAILPYSNILTSAPFTLTVNAEDPYGNVDPTFNGSVTLALSSNPGNATLGGTLTVVAVNGVATFSGLTINKPDSGYTLKASSSGLSNGTTTTFSVLDQLVVTTAPPSSVTAGTSFGLVVKDEDGLGNVITSFNGSVTVANDYYGGTLGGTLTVTAVSGVATFSGLTLTQATTYASLSASSNGLQSATTSDFTVTAAAATKLAVALPYGNILTSASFTVTVNAEDQYGNVATSFNGSVTLALANNPESAILGGTLTVAAVNGVATFSGLTINEPGVGYTLQASSTGLTKGTSTAFSVLDQLVVITPPPSSVTAGSRFGLVVEDEDGLGNVITSFNGSVTVANPYSYYGGTLGGTLTVTAVNGVATFSGLTLTQATSYASLSASSNGLQSATTSYFTVMAAAATKLTLAAPYGTILANALLTVTVNAEDLYGNVDTTFNGSVTLSLASNPGSATLGGTLTTTAVNGVATFSGVTINEPGLGYTLQASSTGLTTGTSTPFSVLDQLVVTTPPPSSVTAGTSFGLVIKDEDGLGNVVTSFNGNVTVANNYYGGTLGGTLTVTAVNGVAAFSGLTLTQATTSASLSASSNGLQSASTSNFTVMAGAASQLVVTVPYGTILANAPFSVTVDGEDSFGNVDPNFSGSVTLSLAGNPGSAILGGTLTATAVNGVATFSGTTINQAGNGYTLQASSTSLTTGNSTPFSVLDQLVVTTPPPSSVAAGSSFGLVVKDEDGLGNVVTSFNGSVTVANDYYGGTLGGTLTVTAVSGVATFSGLTLTQATTYASLSASSNGLQSATTSDFTVTAAAATKLAVALPYGNIPTSAPFTVTVNAEDQYGNVATSFNGSVTLALANNPDSAILGGTLTATAVNGVATFSGLTINKPDTGYTLKASSSGLTTGTSAPFSVLDQLVVTTPPPSSITADSSFGLVVKDEDGLGKVITSFNGSVSVVLNGSYYFGGSSGVLQGTLTVTAVNGVATFSGLKVDQADTYTLTVSSAGLAPVTTNVFNVVAGPATSIEIEGPFGTGPGNAVSSPFGLDVNVEDVYGNIASTFNGSVTLALSSNPGGSDLGGTLTVQAVNGVATFSGLTINNIGNGYTLQATSPGLTTGISAPFDIADQVSVTTPPPSTVMVGSPFGLVVSATVGLGSVDSSYNGIVTVALSSYSGGTTSALGGTTSVTAVNGVATFSGLTVDQGQAGTYGLVVSGTNLIGSSVFFNVIPAAATQLVAISQPATVTAGAGFEVEIAAEDPYGNVDTTFGGSVTLSLANNPGSATLGGTLTATAVNGVATFTGLTLNKVRSGYTLGATSNTLTPVTTNQINVTAPGVANQLIVTTQPIANLTAGTTFDLVVEAEDGFGTADKTFNNSVTLALANNPGGGLGGTTTVTAVNGVATFTGLTVDQAGDGYMLSVTSPDLTSATSNGFNVDAAAASQLVVEGPFGNILTGLPFNLTANAEDQYGNVVPDFYGSVSLALTNNSFGASLGGTLTESAYGGTVIFSNLTINNAGTGFTLQASSTGLTTGTSSSFDVANDQLVVTTQPPSALDGDSTLGLVVTAENASGAVDSSFNGSVTVSLINFGSNTPMLGGTLSVMAVNGLATFSGLTLSQPGTYALSVTDNTTAGTTTQVFNVAPGVSKLVVGSQPPPTVTAGAGFGLDVTAEDSFGNVDTSFNGNVTLALANNPVGGTLGGTVTATAVDGVATFSDLTINDPGNGYTLLATSTGLTQATTNSLNVTPPVVATQLVVTTQAPNAIAAGNAFGLVVQAEDGFGTVDSSFGGSVTLALASGPSNGSLGGTVTVPAVNGVATFTGLTVSLAGTYTLSVASNAFMATTSPITVTAAAATQLSVIESF